MTSKIKVDNINKVSDDSNIINKCGTTITLGASGDTIALASGASQTGFGRTGTVDWDTTAKTTGFTAVSGVGYFVNTTSGAITVTLPAGSAGSIVSLKDYANTWDTNNVTVTPNGTDKINGINENATLNTEDQSVTLVYVDSTKGWRAVQDSTSDVSGVQYISATGGTITTSGNYKIHTFTSPGTFTVCSVSSSTNNNIVSYMVVAGGASGGGGSGPGTPSGGGGGGGAGGFREYKGPADCYTASPLNGNPGGTAVTVTATSFPITVGAGGSPNGPQKGNAGSNSVFSTITSTGGGGGGIYRSAPNPGFNTGNDGGSGGGAGGGPFVGGTGNTPPVSPPQGKNGGYGDSKCGPAFAGAGGGGATAAGGNSTNPVGGPGGAGATTSISGSPTAYAGGGGGGAGNGTLQPGGTGGGGAGGHGSPGSAIPGTANTGGGGGGGKTTCFIGGSGGSGVVIIRYKFQ
jgi:hypothetical protein